MAVYEIGDQPPSCLLAIQLLRTPSCEISRSCLDINRLTLRTFDILQLIPSALARGMCDRLTPGPNLVANVDGSLIVL